jgi:hypothetical protein
MSWTIIYYYHDKPIHLKSLYLSNQSSQIIPIHISHNLPQYEAWKNNDRTLRKHLYRYIDQIIYDNILLIEWDVYINKEIPMINFSSMFGKYMSRDINNGWCWWKDINNLPEYYKKFATGLPLWGFTGIKKDCLKILLDKQYDDIYNMDIHCEIRSPTILTSLGYELSQYPSEWGLFLLDGKKESVNAVSRVLEKDPQKQGFFHPVKFLTSNDAP